VLDIYQKQASMDSKISGDAGLATIAAPAPDDLGGM